ncbi:MAG TPA: Fur family transcriptional regulator [archaeon]|nr:Fur family transcriptional regulator [archaeon]
MPGSELTKVLHNQGLRLTRSRRAVLEVLAASSEHLKVAEVHRRARRIEPRVGLASVYRTMDLLERLHLVKHVHMEHRHRHYARITGHHGHHLVCNGCGLVVEFTDCQLERLTRTLARRTKFQIEGHCVEFFGRCRKCRTQASEHPSRGGRKP